MKEPQFEDATEKVLETSIELGEVDIKDAQGNLILKAPDYPIIAKKKVIDDIQIVRGKIEEHDDEEV